MRVKRKRDNSIAKKEFDYIKNLKLKIKNKKIDKSVFDLFNNEKKNYFIEIENLKYNFNLTNDLTRKLIFFREIF